MYYENILTNGVFLTLFCNLDSQSARVSSLKLFTFKTVDSLGV